MDLATGRSFWMKLSFHEMFRRFPIISEMYFDEWYNWAIRFQIEPMIKLAQYLKMHKDGISTMI